MNLAQVDPKVQEIVFAVSIYEYESRRQNFGQVRNSFIRIYDAHTNDEAIGRGYSGGLQTLVDKYYQQ